MVNSTSNHIGLLLIASFLSILSCTSFQEEEFPVRFGVNASELTFGVSSSIRSVTVSCGSKWDISSKPAWVDLQSIERSTISPYEWVVSFSAESNEEYNREGQIVIKTNTESTEIAVSQTGKKGKHVAVESVILAPPELILTEGESASLSYNVLPANASVKEVSWKSSATSIATVSETGQVDALAPGTATIIVTTNDGSKTDSCDVTVLPNNNIHFSDSGLKQYLLTYYDTDNDNEISYEEAATATSIVSLNSLRSITSFDEFQYFTGVSTIPDNWLKDCRTLKSIVLPPSITRIGTSAFENCEGLTGINLNRNIIIEDKAFANSHLVGIYKVACFTGSAFVGTDVSDIYTYSESPDDYSDFDLCLQEIPESATLHINNTIFDKLNDAVEFMTYFPQTEATFKAHMAARVEEVCIRLVDIESKITNYRDNIIPAIISGDLDIDALSGLPGLSLNIDAIQYDINGIKTSATEFYSMYKQQNTWLTPYFESIRIMHESNLDSFYASYSDEIDILEYRLECCRDAYNSLFAIYESLTTSQLITPPQSSIPNSKVRFSRSFIPRLSTSEIVESFHKQVVSFTP